ncbi:MAG: hypothetical protein M3Q77_07335 [Thermoproteota archaeon]|nr:hypothetical protein [Thermoproteota archaeon]
MLSLNTQGPTLSTVKALSLTDLAVMSYSSHLLRKRLTSYFHIDCFTTPDPFSKEDEFNYFIVVDKANTNRIISFIALKEVLDIDLWDLLFGKDMLRLDISKEDALSLKEELMPKYTDNFFPIRKDSSIIGYIAFSFEICGMKN